MEHGDPSVGFDIYLAYASPDGAFAEELHRRLEPHCRVLFDRNLAPGTLWDTALPEALQASRTIVVLVSKQSASHWYFGSEIVRRESDASAFGSGRDNPGHSGWAELPCGLERGAGHRCRCDRRSRRGDPHEGFHVLCGVRDVDHEPFRVSPPATRQTAPLGSPSLRSVQQLPDTVSRSARTRAVGAPA